MATTAPTSTRIDAATLRAELTDKYSTKRFAMEYGGYLSNHLLHGAVALFDIGASRQQIEDFADHYAAKKLVAVAPDHIDPFHVETVERSDTTNAPVAIPSQQRLDTLLGKREDFDALLAFYGREVRLLGADAAVQKHLPTLVAGLCGALLHGLIQLGYAYHIGGDRLIAEGLAYLHFSYLSFEDSSVSAPRDGNQDSKDDTADTSSSSSKTAKRAFTRDEALRAVHALRHQELVLSEMRARLESRAISELPLGLFQRKLNAISAHPERGSAAAFQLVAGALAQFDLSDLRGDVALDFSLWLYTMIEHNDFVIAHAVTSAWSLQQLEHLLSAHDRARAWRVWLHVAVSAFILQEVHDLSADDICAQTHAELPALDSWNDILAHALALEGYPDEHVYKVVQVAYEHATGGAGASAGGDGAEGKGRDSDSSSRERSRFLSAEERDFVARKAASKVVALEFERI